MKTLCQLILGVGVMLAFSLPAQTNPAKTTTLKGTVVDTAGGAVAGATVETFTYAGRLHSDVGDLESKQRAVTDASGAFELQFPGSGTLILARKAGLAPAWKQIARVPGVEQRMILTAPAVLAGTVVDEADKPVAGAEVSVAVAFSETMEEGGRRTFNYLSGKPARECFSARTTADGRFRIEGFPTNASANLTVRVAGKTLSESRQEYLSPDTMQCRAGQEDIRLVMEPAGSVEGKIVAEGDGPPLPAAHLTLQPDGPGSFGLGDREPALSAADGTFRIPDVGAGSYRLRAVFGTNQLPDWVAETVSVSVDTGQATRDARISATRGGLVELVVLGKADRKPLAQVNVSVYREGYQTGAVSGSNGTAMLRLPPGDYQVSAIRENSRPENTSANVEAGKTNRVEIELGTPPKIAGVVRRPDGQPAAGLEVRIVGGYGDRGAAHKTDANGSFEVEWDPRQFGPSDRTHCLLIRDAERNLAVAEDIDEDTGPLELRLAPALTIVGSAECAAKPITNATAALVFWTGNSGMHLQGLGTGTNTPGRFEIPALPPGRRYGVQVSAPGYGQKFVNTVDSDEAKRVEMDPVELKPANLKIAGQVVDADDKPAAGANVHLYGEGQPNGNTRTDREGRFRFDQVCEGQAQLSANLRNSHGSISAEGGETNVFLKLGESYGTYSGSTPRKLKGIVTDPEGKPVVGAQVAVFPSGTSRWVKTITNGTFNLNWTLQPWQLQSGGDPCLVVRDMARNFAAVESISEDATNLDVQLKPALTLAGRVQGPDEAPLANAQVGVWLLASRTYSQVSEQLAATDARGGFEIKTLPAGAQYIVFAKAKDHGRHQEQITEDFETNRIELPPFVLKLADQIVAGQVMNQSDKPVPGVHVSLSGDDQPEGSSTTDSKGRFSFKVCEGQVRLFASGQNSYGNITAEAGDTNVVIQLGMNEPYVREGPKRPSLKGKPLPDLTAVGLAGDAAPPGKPLLLCLLDAEQRPSRRSARMLAEQYDALRQKGLTVLAVQAAVTGADSFETWKNSNPLPFPVGRVAEKSAATKWATDVESLPWLILRDAQGGVAAEGFALDELDAKLEALKK